MFVHNFKYTFKTLIKNKMLIFWTFAFPILLGIFFNMAFSDIENNEKLDIIDIAIVNNNDFENNEIYKESFSALSDTESDEQLFNIEYVDEEKAKELLENEDISGYLLLDQNKQKIVVKENGINQTVLKYVVEEIAEIEKIMTNVANKKISDELLSLETGIIDYDSFYSEIYASVIEIINQDTANIKDISSNNLSYTMIEYYTLIAMACLYSGILAMTAVNQNLANMSHNGKRMSVSPASKLSLILGSVLASYIVSLIGIALLFIFTVFVLHVDYGNNLFLVILLASIGTLAGLSIGLAVSCLIKNNENAKTGIIIAVTMLGCFLSGMMGITMKYIIDKNVPFINKINPASMITDGFYSLYYYDTLDRFYFNVISLLIFSIILISISFLSLRRQKYDSI